jgi:hypothetical protein
MTRFLFAELSGHYLKKGSPEGERLRGANPSATIRGSKQIDDPRASNV